MAGKKVIHRTAKNAHPVYAILVPLLLCALCYLIASLLPRLSAVEIMEWRLYDWRMREKPLTKSHYPDPAIAIIAMDEDSFRSIKEPTLLWVSKYTAILKALHEAGAKIVGFDYIQVKTPDQFVLLGIDPFIDRIAASREKKKAFKDQIKSYQPHFDNEFGNMVKETSAILVTIVEEKSNKFLGSSTEIELFAGLENIASAHLQSEKDGVARAVPSRSTGLFEWPDGRIEKRSFFSFSFLVACRYLGKEKEFYEGSYEKEIPLYEGNSMLINYISLWDPACGRRSFMSIPFYKVDERARKNDKQFFIDSFKGKIVLFGATDLSSQDLKKTPFTYSTEFPGVEVQANAINTIIHNDYIRKVPSLYYSMALLMLIIACFFLGCRLPLPASISISGGLLLSYWCFAFHIFKMGNQWLPLAVPIIAIPMVLLVSYAYRFVTEEREKKWIRGALCRYVSDPVAQEILNNPALVKLGGEEREITVLFSDINHFTTISESRTPEEITEVLNDYFTLMEDVIFRHRGTLKQFVGDEIMVMFGAPARQEDHRERAVRTALDMKEVLTKWRVEREKEGKIHFGVKMGIHSGKVVVGNVGSPRRTEYAAIGDTVNTTARIMGLNKTLDTDILMSEEIYSAVKDEVTAEDKGCHQVKGKAQQLHVFSLLGRKA
jgi:class 3 adenylate cyclase/CHASE2 domain-containing sensor protein